MSRRHQLLWRSKWYKDLRRRMMTQEPMCRMCSKEGLSVAAEELDHIIPLHLRPDLAQDENNLQPLCRPHHQQKTARENSKRAGANLEGDLVYGHTRHS